MRTIQTRQIFAVVLLLAATLTACAKEPAPGPQKPVKLSIWFSTSPRPVKAGQAAILKVQVERGNELVDGADVSIETWQDGEENHQMDKAAPAQSGTYTVQKTFAKPGTYHAVLHTTTSDIHQMPQVDFQVEQQRGAR